jgi:hypothetical protein
LIFLRRAVEKVGGVVQPSFQGTMTMTTATKLANAPKSTDRVDLYKKFHDAYRALEGKLRDVVKIAAIAELYVHQVVIEGAKQVENGDAYQLRLSDREFGELNFLIGHVRDMAADLEKDYDAAFSQSRATAEQREAA